MKPTKKILNERDKVVFNKALKVYFFSRQQGIRKLNTDLQERFRYTGSVAYSLIVNFILKDKLEVEFMDFLNMEIKKLQSLNSGLLDPLQVQPAEIALIELNKKIDLQVFDEVEKRNITISYLPENNLVELLVEE